MHGRSMPRRIVVKGTSGAGKSTFASALAARLGVPWIELDALHWGPNWSMPEEDVFRAQVRAAIDACPDGWVVDGNYDSRLGGTVLDAADTIVWPCRSTSPCVDSGGARCTGSATSQGCGTATTKLGARTSPAAIRSSSGRCAPAVSNGAPGQRGSAMTRASSGSDRTRRCSAGSTLRVARKRWRFDSLH